MTYGKKNEVTMHIPLQLFIFESTQMMLGNFMPANKPFVYIYLHIKHFFGKHIVQELGIFRT